jgi:YHS domain-containing protein
MSVTVAEAKTARLSTEHQGKKYFFCNETCKKKFDAAPAKYMVTASAQAADIPHKP